MRGEPEVQPWSAHAPGVVVLPSGRRVRGRSLRDRASTGQDPTLAVHLARRPPPRPDWKRYWIRWADFWLPSDLDEAGRILAQAHARAGDERLEIACPGGVGRTGTSIAGLCVLEGMTPRDAVAWTRAHYHHRAVEVPWQRRVLQSMAQHTSS